MIGRELDELAALSSVADAVDRPHGHARPAARGRRPPGRPGAGRRRASTPARSSGIAGLLGSGRTELVRLLYGADRADTGRDRGQRHSAQGHLAAARHRPPHRLLVRGPPRRRDHRRPHRRREHRARHPGPARRAAQDRACRAGRRRRGVHRGARRAPGRPESCSPATCRAATSRRCCSRAGWPPRPS